MERSNPNKNDGVYFKLNNTKLWCSKNINLINNNNNNTLEIIINRRLDFGMENIDLFFLN